MTAKDPFVACRWIVFDVTGTLLTPDPPAAAVYRQAALRFDRAPDLATVQARFRAALVRHFAAPPAAVADSLPTVAATAAAAGQATQPADAEDRIERLRWRRIVADTLAELSDSQAEEAFQDLWTHFADPRHWRLIEGVDRLVSGLLAADRNLAIATNLDRRVHRLLDAHPPLHRIRRRYLSSTIGWAKPDRRFFDHVAAALAVAPDQILMVGDDPENDVAGSRRAGWRSVAIDDVLPRR